MTTNFFFYMDSTIARSVNAGIYTSYDMSAAAYLIWLELTLMEIPVWILTNQNTKFLWFPLSILIPLNSSNERSENLVGP